jgi:hypothetical protein
MAKYSTIHTNDIYAINVMVSSFLEVGVACSLFIPTVVATWIMCSSCGIHIYNMVVEDMSRR